MGQRSTVGSRAMDHQNARPENAKWPLPPASTLTYNTTYLDNKKQSEYSQAHWVFFAEYEQLMSCE
jgi:hypothetical protein